MRLVLPWFRPLLPLLAALLGSSCHPAAAPFVAIAAADAVTVAVFHRDSLDLAYSLATGKNCSIVRLDEGLSYCKPHDLPAAPPLFCTHSLGVVDCYDDPAGLPQHPRGVGDGPEQTAEQKAAGMARWPDL